jgi:hypothetical protein
MESALLRYELQAGSGSAGLQQPRAECRLECSEDLGRRLVARGGKKVKRNLGSDQCGDVENGARVLRESAQSPTDDVSRSRRNHGHAGVGNRRFL